LQSTQCGNKFTQKHQGLRLACVLFICQVMWWLLRSWKPSMRWSRRLKKSIRFSGICLIIQTFRCSTDFTWNRIHRLMISCGLQWRYVDCICVCMHVCARNLCLWLGYLVEIIDCRDGIITWYLLSFSAMFIIFIIFFN